jgi:hypothetical protein
MLDEDDADSLRGGLPDSGASRSELAKSSDAQEIDLDDKIQLNTILNEVIRVNSATAGAFFLCVCICYVCVCLFAFHRLIPRNGIHSV